VIRGLFVLSSSEESFEAGVTDETEVRIRGPVDLQRRVFDQHAYPWVSVGGAFRLREKDASTDDLLLGEIHAPLDVRSLRNPAQLFGEVRQQLGFAGFPVFLAGLLPER